VVRRPCRSSLNLHAIIPWSGRSSDTRSMSMLQSNLVPCAMRSGAIYCITYSSFRAGTAAAYVCGLCLSWSLTTAGHTARQLMMIRHRPVRNGMFLNVLRTGSTTLPLVLSSVHCLFGFGTDPNLVSSRRREQGPPPPRPLAPPPDDAWCVLHHVPVAPTICVLARHARSQKGRVHAAPPLRVCAFVY
jgi:hypothetical protein